MGPPASAGIASVSAAGPVVAGAPEEAFVDVETIAACDVDIAPVAAADIAPVD